LLAIIRGVHEVPTYENIPENTTPPVAAGGSDHAIHTYEIKPENTIAVAAGGRAT
jgi:hypothetical protein